MGIAEHIVGRAMAEITMLPGRIIDAKYCYQYYFQEEHKQFLLVDVYQTIVSEGIRIQSIIAHEDEKIVHSDDDCIVTTMYRKPTNQYLNTYYMYSNVKNLVVPSAVLTIAMNNMVSNDE